MEEAEELLSTPPTLPQVVVLEVEAEVLPSTLQTPRQAVVLVAEAEVLPSILSTLRQAVVHPELLSALATRRRLPELVLQEAVEVVQPVTVLSREPD